jgi:hypothetical protein
MNKLHFFTKFFSLKSGVWFIYESNKYYCLCASSPFLAQYLGAPLV